MIYFLNATEVSKEDSAQIKVLLEAYYNTQHDPDQIPITEKSVSWIKAHIPDCITLIKEDQTVVGKNL